MKLKVKIRLEVREVGKGQTIKGFMNPIRKFSLKL